jgi:probable F420-dependent oxidoreductase
LGTHVYNLGLRHPFVAARAVQTADVVSEGRLELGVGAGWLRSEWVAAGLDFDTRGARLDEALEVCQRLWSEEHVAHHGRFFDFEAVAFEPKPVQRPHPPLSIGGESPAALRRAARHDGWIGLNHSAETVRIPVQALAELRAAAGLTSPFTITVGATVAGDDDVEALSGAGVDRVIVSPWVRTRDVPDALTAFARRFLGS